VAERDEMSALAPLDRAIRWLASRRSGALFAMFLVWFVVWTGVAYLLLDWIVADEHQEGLATIAAPLMTSFGALFAFLTAFVITAEWNQHRDIEQTVGKEADACVRLIWASESPGCDGPGSRGRLLRYLRVVRGVEWPTLGTGGEGCEQAHALMTDLQHHVRTMADSDSVRTSAASELTKAADAMAVTRADRLNAAGHDLPTPLFFLASISGVMLTLNSVALSLHLERGYAIVIAGLVILVALDLALLVALMAPFSGALRVHGRALARVLDELESGVYGPVEEMDDSGASAGMEGPAHGRAPAPDPAVGSERTG
jgi:hypothetical protein